MGRITDLIRSGEAYRRPGRARRCVRKTDRAMICGNLAFNLELKDMLEEYGAESKGPIPNRQQYVVEKAFLD
jgi:ferredoxin--NADP+ reductase